ncbi:MAG: NAD-dependent deacylase [Paracoccaceae bacterium]
MDRIVVLTGAGISAESGLGTFRDVGGLWSRYDLREVATAEGYAADPDLVLGFYNARRENALGARPNPAHEALAALQRAAPDRVTIVTQNIDDLHERAGAREVWHMHGRIHAALCARCDHRWDWAGAMTREHACPACGAAGGVRPDVVWFGEIPHHLDEIAEALDACDLFVAIGTSGAVYPAAGFVLVAARAGARTLELNLERSEVSGLFRETRLGPASRVVPDWVEETLSRE